MSVPAPPPTPTPTTERTLIFAGGGTGGHIFPALAIWERVRELDPTCRAVFLCSDRAIDERILDGAKDGATSWRPLPARPFGLGPKSLGPFVRSWGKSLRAARETIRECKRDERAPVLVAMGGFVAAPAAQAARVERIASTLVNLDAAPGKANRWIAKRCARSLTALPVPERALPGSAEVIGPIVRTSARPPEMSKAECRTKLGLDPERTTLVVTGGSQGAASVNAFVLAMAEKHPAVFANAQVLHQAGSKAGEADAVREQYKSLGVRAHVTDLVSEIGLWWASADWAIGRAGAGTVMEAWAANVPSVFLPYPWHRDQHQRRNAESLERAGACVIIDDRKRCEATLASSWDQVRAIATDPEARGRMRDAFETLGDTDGARRAADLILAS